MSDAVDPRTCDWLFTRYIISDLGNARAEPLMVAMLCETAHPSLSFEHIPRGCQASRHHPDADSHAVSINGSQSNVPGSQGIDADRF